MRTHLHTTLNKSRDERTETAGEGRGTRRGDPAAVDVWLSDWLSVAKILRIPGIGSIPLLRDSIPLLRVSIPLLRDSIPLLSTPPHPHNQAEPHTDACSDGRVV